MSQKERARIWRPALNSEEETFMAKRKQKTFRADKIVKEMARERIGAPPASRIVPDRKKKAQEQKPTTKELLDED
jgi:hypothetical protein